MPSAVNNHIFGNKRPKLLGNDTHAATLTGSDTHAASLTGSMSLVDPIVDGNNSAGTQATFSGNITGDLQITSVTITATQPENKVYLLWSVLVSTDPSSQIREGANVLGTTAGAGFGVRNTVVILNDVSIGVHTYTFWTIRNTTDYQYGATPGGFPAGDKWRALGFIVDANDTHAATLTGSDTHAATLTGVNTDKTKNNNIIKG